jgi:hypothetical protein
MSGIYDNFNNLNTSFIPNPYKPQFNSKVTSPNLGEVTPNKPFELRNNDGSLKGYFWYKGNSVSLVFNVEGEILLTEQDTYITANEFLS